MEIDLSQVADENLDEVLQLLQTVADHKKYNSMLSTALERSYPWQRQAVKFTKDHKVIGVTCGNQMGKSEITCAILAVQLTGVYPKWWTGKKYDRPVRVMAAGVDSNHNKNVIQERLFGTNNFRLKEELGSGMIPKDSIFLKSVVSQRGDGIDSVKIKHSSGGWSELIFRSYSQGREAAQGFPADIIMIDEQPNDDFWREALTRTRATRGHVICSFTPLLGKTGLVEQLMDLDGLTDGPEDMFGPKFRSDGKWACIRASWHDAPHIPAADIEDAKRDYTYDYNARVYGMPIAGYGAIFRHLESDMVYDPREKHIDDTWPHIIGLDIGHQQDELDKNRDPSAAILCAWDEKDDVIYLTDMWTGPSPTVRDLAKGITSVNHVAPVAWPNDAGRTSMTVQTTIAEQLRERGINLLGKPFLNPRGADGKKNNFKMPGLQEMNNRFAEGKLLVNKDLVLLVEQMTGYAFDKNGKIQDGNDDMIDAFRYAVMSIIQGFGEPLVDPPWPEDDEEYTYNSY